MRTVRIIKLGDFSLPYLEPVFNELSSLGYSDFNFESDHVPIPEPDYKIADVIEEYSFELVLSILGRYRQVNRVSDDVVLVGIINRRIERNYFSFTWVESGCSVISVGDVENVIKPFTLSQFLRTEIVRHVVAIIEDHAWHPEPRRCAYDFCGDRRDIVASLTAGALCDSCRKALSIGAKDLLNFNDQHTFQDSNPMAKRAGKILFVSADPSDTSRLGIQKELRSIQAELQMAAGRDGFHFEAHFAIRPSDLSRALLQKPRPKYLHFSGHGNQVGAICLENDAGHAHPITGAALGSLLEPISADLVCVLLNACYSRAQADVILKHVPFVIGMKDSIGDRAATAYSVGFYQAIFNGEDVPTAHRLACAQVHMVAEGEHETPELLETTNSASMIQKKPPAP